MSDPTIPGLEAPPGAVSNLEAGVRQTLAQLREAGRITSRDSGKVALALELAQVIAHKRSTGRASTIGNDARVLMDILDSFVPPASEVDADLAAAMAEWSEVLSNG